MRLEDMFDTSEFKWLNDQRVKNGFVYDGTCEADPRTIDSMVNGWPERIGWARDRDGNLYVTKETYKVECEWVQFSEEQWTEIFPHASVPPTWEDSIKNDVLDDQHPY